MICMQAEEVTCTQEEAATSALEEEAKTCTVEGAESLWKEEEGEGICSHHENSCVHIVEESCTCAAVETSIRDPFRSSALLLPE